jgi:hypothetical protein
LQRRVVWQKFTNVSEVLAASILIDPMMEAARTSETLVNFYQTTRRDIPELIQNTRPWGQAQYNLLGMNSEWTLAVVVQGMSTSELHACFSRGGGAHQFMGPSSWGGTPKNLPLKTKTTTT